MKPIAAKLVYCVFLKLRRQVDDVYSPERALVHAYHAADAQVFIYPCLSVRINIDALITFAVDRAYPDAEEIAASYRIAFLFVYNCYSFDHKQYKIRNRL